MGLLELILGRKKSVTKHEVAIGNKEDLDVHIDIQNLLWIGDGPKKNYEISKEKHVFRVQGIEFVLPSMHQEEPSLIYTKLPINKDIVHGLVERPPYYPTYTTLTAEQRGVYWKLLTNPYDAHINIGYVFILYYGLERQLLLGNYEKAFEVILKLRDVHTNKSFQFYSAHAIILTCICKQRADLAVRFIHSLDKDHELQFGDSMLLLCKYGLNLPLNAKEIMKLSNGIGVSNQHYIKDYPDLFEAFLVNNIRDNYSTDMLFITSMLSSNDGVNIPKQKARMFANMSIIGEYIEIPDFTQATVIQGGLYKLLHTTHEQVKTHLKQLRKRGIVVEKNKVGKEVQEIKCFNEVMEKELLKEVEDKKATLLDKHFNLIKLQDFYYKYRDLDDVYLQKCIMYCIQDVDLLEDLQKEYYQLEILKIKQFESIYSETELERRINEIEVFKGNIPAFKRLAIIYEKKKDYAKVVYICERAISYYQSIKMIESAEDFSKRKNKYKLN